MGEVDAGQAPDDFSGASRFVTTHWSVILTAREADSPGASAALETLCRTYWYPLYVFVRRSGHDGESAKDLTQGFFERFLEKHYLKDVNRNRGRFRSFLLASMKHFLANEWDRRQTLRRGGGRQIVSLEEEWIAACERQDAALAVSPDRLYERRWAMTVLDRARQRLRADYFAAGKSALSDALQIYLAGDRGATPYAEMAGRLDLSVDALKKAVERLRRRFAELLREEVGHTVMHPAEIDDELRYLRSVLGAN